MTVVAVFLQRPAANPSKGCCFGGRTFCCTVTVFEHLPHATDYCRTSNNSRFDYLFFSRHYTIEWLTLSIETLYFLFPHKLLHKIKFKIVDIDGIAVLAAVLTE